jgi:hypothetical protein
LETASTRGALGAWVRCFSIFVLADAHAHHGAALWSKITDSLGSNFAVISAIVVPFVIGEFLDCLRDLWEHLADKISEIKWEKLKNLSEEKHSVFEDYYFVYYVFNMNLSIGLVTGYVLTVVLRIFPTDYCLAFSLGALIMLLVFFINALSLRVEIKRFLDDEKAGR